MGDRLDAATKVVVAGSEDDLASSIPRFERPTAAGTTMSRYVVLEEVGRGAMGRVLRAYDPKLQREVALKEVKRGAEASGRIVAEARAMAKLSHPNVVGVYDVEELVTGAVILVMEYVSGQTLGDWLKDRATRPWREITAHFVLAGRGLVAAHEAGLLHRDFKPANVLVAGDGTVKVTDFGLAKFGEGAFSGPNSGDESDTLDLSQHAMTQAGTIMGTPRYMAPEQHDGAALGPAADQYAFCVALWEALCGAPPFGGQTLSEDKTKGPGKWPNPATPGPIVAAILRGLAPDPRKRWASMAELLTALAWDPSRRRNRILIAAGGVGVAAALATSYGLQANASAQKCKGAAAQLAGIWDENRRTAVETAMLAIDKSYVHDTWSRTRDALDGYALEWAAMHTDVCEATSIRGEQSHDQMDRRMACLHRAVVELRAAVDMLASADEQVAQNAHELTDGLRPLSMCSDPAALAAEVEPPRPEEASAVETARDELARAKILQNAGRFEDARRVIESVKSALAEVAYEPVRTEVAIAEGDVLERLGQYEAAEAALVGALRMSAAWRQWDELGAAATLLMYVVGDRQKRMEEGLRYRAFGEGLFHGRPELEAAWRGSLANVLSAQGKYAEAEVEQRIALALWESAVGPSHASAATARNNVASLLYEQGKYAEAEAELRTALAVFQTALGPEHPDVGMALANLANALYQSGKLSEAADVQRAALALREKALGPEHPSVFESRNNLTAVLYAQGKYAEAEVEYRAALAERLRVHGPDDPGVAMTRNNLGSVLYSQGKGQEAEIEYRAALAVIEKVYGPDHPEAGTERNNLANALRIQGKLEEAETEQRAALTLWQKALGADHPDVAASHNNLGVLLGMVGKLAEAEAEHRAALAIREHVLAPDHASIAESQDNLATILLERGQPAEALPLAEKAWALRQRGEVPPAWAGETAFLLGRLLWISDRSTGARARARQLAQEALALYSKADGKHADELEEIREWLAAHPLR